MPRRDAGPGTDLADAPGLFYDDIDGTPDRIWDRPGQVPVLESREWLGLPRWPRDGAGYLVAGRSLLPMRLVSDPHGWPAMNLVDACAGEALGLGSDDATVAAARATVVPHLMVAAPGYHTVPVGGRDPRALGRLVDAVEREAADRKVTWGFAHLPPEADSLLTVLRERGYQIAVVSATAHLDLPGREFGDYLAAFGHHRRNQISRERRQFAEAGGTVSSSSGAGAADWFADSAGLEAELQRSHGFDADPDYFRETQQAYLRRFGDRMHLLRAQLGGETVAMVTLFRGGDDLAGRTVGLRDGPAVHAAGVYFNVCYYGVIDLAYRLGIRRVRLGPRAWRAKARRGARLVPLRAAIPPTAPEPLRALLAQTAGRSQQVLDGQRPAARAAGAGA